MKLKVLSKDQESIPRPLTSRLKIVIDFLCLSPAAMGCTNIVKTDPVPNTRKWLAVNSVLIIGLNGYHTLSWSFDNSKWGKHLQVSSCTFSPRAASRMTSRHATPLGDPRGIPKKCYRSEFRKKSYHSLVQRKHMRIILRFIQSCIAFNPKLKKKLKVIFGHYMKMAHSSLADLTDDIDIDILDILDFSEDLPDLGGSDDLFNEQIVNPAQSTVDNLCAQVDMNNSASSPQDTTLDNFYSEWNASNAEPTESIPAPVEGENGQTQGSLQPISKGCISQRHEMSLLSSYTDEAMASTNMAPSFDSLHFNGEVSASPNTYTSPQKVVSAPISVSGPKMTSSECPSTVYLAPIIYELPSGVTITSSSLLVPDTTNRNQHMDGQHGGLLSPSLTAQSEHQQVISPIVSPHKNSSESLQVLPQISLENQHLVTPNQHLVAPNQCLISPNQHLITPNQLLITSYQQLVAPKQQNSTKIQLTLTPPSPQSYKIHSPTTRSYQNQQCGSPNASEKLSIVSQENDKMIPHYLSASEAETLNSTTSSSDQGSPMHSPSTSHSPQMCAAPRKYNNYKKMRYDNNRACAKYRDKKKLALTSLKEERDALLVRNAALKEKLANVSKQIDEAQSKIINNYLCRNNVIQINKV